MHLLRFTSKKIHAVHSLCCKEPDCIKCMVIVIVPKCSLFLPSFPFKLNELFSIAFNSAECLRTGNLGISYSVISLFRFPLYNIFFKVSSKYFFSTCYWNEMRCSWSVCICFFLAALPKRLGGGKCRASLRVFGNCQWVIPRQKELQNYFWSGPMSSHIHYFEV